MGSAIFRAAIEALAPLSLRVLVTTGQELDLGPVPPHIQVRPWVDQADVLAAADAVLCHGGSGTMLGALAAGVPMVIYPMFADQRRNAVALRTLGLARIVEPDGDTAAERGETSPGAVATLRQSVAELLVDDAARATARRLAAERTALPTPGELLTGLVP